MIRIGQWRRANGLCRPVSQIASRSSGQSLVTSRAASLSAIHRGVRRSERVQFGERSLPRSRSPPGRGGDGDRRGSALTSRALGGAASPRQQQKLRKKLDRKADDEEESGRQTRRKRFIDPESPFGKKSLVYQLKHGAWKDEAAALPLKEPVRPLSSRSLRPDVLSRRDDWTPSPRLSRSDVRSRRDDWTPSPRPPRSDVRSGRDDWTPSPRPPRSDVQSGRDDWQSSPRPASEGWRHEAEDEAHAREHERERGRKKTMMPMNIKYTTAASQFLYGKSVVKAALEHGRRMLYNLYIYGGDNRRDSRDNDVIAGLAQKRGVPVTIVPNGEQRLMDKMSMGRPHNGFVLETSPLPQLPVTWLGELEETSARLGFHVALGHQSKEEEAVNGRDTFIKRKNDITAKPLVLLLNEILDPGNLGGLLRTASYLGVDAVGITNRSSSTLTPVVLKSAAGAVEEVTVFTVDSPVTFIEQSKKAGWKTYAAVAPPEAKLARMHGDKFISTDAVERANPLAASPCILVLGNEGYGLSKPIKMAADYEVSVPRFVQGSCVDSLNVSVAAGLLCHAFVKAALAEKSRTKAAMTAATTTATTTTTTESESNDSEGESEAKKGEALF